MMGTFNNREIAGACWLVVLLAWMLPKAAVRKSLGGVLQAFFQRKILASVCIMALYSAAAAILLTAIDLWRVSLLKDTIVWFCASAMVMVMRFVTSRDSESIFREVLAESLTIVIVLEFLFNTYTFSLPIELVLMPVLALVVMVNALASSDKQYSEVAKITRGIQTAFGFGILAIVLIRAVSDLKALESLDTVRSIALAPLLSLLFVPCLYILVLISQYELVFMRLDVGAEKDHRVKRYARRRILMHVGLSMKKVRHLLREHLIDLTHIQTEADVDRIVAQATDS